MSDSGSRYRWFRFAAIFTFTLIFTLPLPLYVGVPLSITAAIAVEYPAWHEALTVAVVITILSLFYYWPR